jgi:ankyrin repeat protein
MSTSTPSEELHDAVCSGNIGAIEGLIKQGADVNYVDEGSGWALLLWAVKTNHAAILDLLLKHGANVDAGGNLFHL